MRPQARSTLRSDVLVLSGYGLRVSVARGHLVMEDGIADRRRVRRLSRIDRTVRRVAIVGHAGTISLDAIRWLDDVKIPLIHLDADGRVLPSWVRMHRTIRSSVVGRRSRPTVTRGSRSPDAC